jgi:hypothetical protein
MGGSKIDVIEEGKGVDEVLGNIKDFLVENKKESDGSANGAFARGVYNPKLQ